MIYEQAIKKAYDAGFRVSTENVPGDPWRKMILHHKNGKSFFAHEDHMLRDDDHLGHVIAGIEQIEGQTP